MTRALGSSRRSTLARFDVSAETPRSFDGSAETPRTRADALMVLVESFLAEGARSRMGGTPTESGSTSRRKNCAAAAASSRTSDASAFPRRRRDGSPATRRWSRSPVTRPAGPCTRVAGRARFARDAARARDPTPAPLRVPELHPHEVPGRAPHRALGGRRRDRARPPPRRLSSRRRGTARERRCLRRRGLWHAGRGTGTRTPDRDAERSHVTSRHIPRSGNSRGRVILTNVRTSGAQARGALKRTAHTP